MGHVNTSGVFILAVGIFNRANLSLLNISNLRVVFVSVVSDEKVIFGHENVRINGCILSVISCFVFNLSFVYL